MSTPLRQAKIEALILGAAEAMEAIPSATASETMAAVFLLAQRTMRAVLDLHPEVRGECLQAAQILMLQCADEDHPL